ncbi:MAG: beta-mannosidase [Leadbetterella sp.]|nr:beta-mannosidase [Leadbetterella sp.]
MVRIKSMLCILLMGLGANAAGQELMDSKSSQLTHTLYTKLAAQQGKKIMIGHQDATAYGIAWRNEPCQSDIKKVTGQFPAVYGWDMGHLELGDSLNIDHIPFAAIRQMMIDGYNRGGVNTVSWHLKNPFTGGSSWDVSSDKVVRSILPGGEKHELYKTWLDRLAHFFKSVKNVNGEPIPILFRPFHEHSGSWFWWGRNLCTPEDYKALWHFTVSYLKDVQNVHHLIYVYSPDFVSTEKDYFERFPGNEYVDILGLDLYHRGGGETAQKYISDVSRILKFLAGYAEKHGKLYTFSETGAEGIPMKDWFTKVLYPAISSYKPLYVLLWRNAYETPGHFYAPYPGHPAEPNFKEFSAYPDILLEKKLPALYNPQP